MKQPSFYRLRWKSKPDLHAKQPSGSVDDDYITALSIYYIQRTVDGGGVVIFVGLLPSAAGRCDGCKFSLTLRSCKFSLTLRSCKFSLTLRSCKFSLTLRSCKFSLTLKAASSAWRWEAASSAWRWEAASSAWRWEAASSAWRWEAASSASHWEAASNAGTASSTFAPQAKVASCAGAVPDDTATS